MKKNLKWDQILRFRMIEIIALWEGRLTTNHLCSAFSIGRQQASRDIRRYQSFFEREPQLLDRSLKGYRPSQDFVPRFSQGSASEYLMLLHQQNQMIETFDFLEVGYAQSAVLNVLERPISPVIVRGLIQAAREQRRVDIDYISLSTPHITGRNLVPHTIVNDGYRWHVRAYCERREEYRDFVLSRFRNQPDLLDRSPFGCKQDHQWNQVTEIAVIPNPYLDLNQQKIIADDYGMQNKQLLIKTRNALVKYVIKRLHLCLEDNQLKANPKAFQLTVTNLDEVRRHLVS